MISRAHAAGLNWLAVSSWCALSSLVHTTAARTRADNEHSPAVEEVGTDRTLMPTRSFARSTASSSSIFLRTNFCPAAIADASGCSNPTPCSHTCSSATYPRRSSRSTASRSPLRAAFVKRGARGRNTSIVEIGIRPLGRLPASARLTRRVENCISSLAFAEVIAESRVDTLTAEATDEN